MNYFQATICPSVILKTRVGDDKILGGGCAIGGTWKDVNTDVLFKDKRIVIFSLPGAYTPTCSSQQVPGYEEKYDELRKFVHEVYCVSVNDAFVMNAWFRDQKIYKVKPIGDGEGKFTKSMNMLVNKPKQGFGMRSWRYSALVEDGKVVKLFIEEGKNDNSNDNDPFKVSDADTMLRFLQERMNY
ncbi:MAG: peroxiredoxin [Pelagibacteraceae bacterium]|jgi:peroxiredoxin|nr:peroxiredoxin [Pelagibacteraceae bacterium]MBT3902664.1 peroxiredoxin [Pelagibacteraceae bacterium]MBT4646167.1 peroxiredoxin [Pelagibacteraceae bacterium]MBT4951469.1 peroxiredoxin [Pelagibacteraceae bacterium]MBT5213103.1 peroxiredoxin [Pelagibacteraceae bacterium]